MWFDPGLAGLFITSTLLHLGENINLLVVSNIQNNIYIYIAIKSLRTKFDIISK